MLHRSLVLGFVLSTALSGSARAVTLIDSTRIVLADTSYDVFLIDADNALDGEARTTPGPWVGAAVSASQLGDLAQATAETTQDSTVTTNDPLLDLRVAGGGAAGAAFDVNDAGQPSRAKSFGTTSIEVVFDVAAPAEIALAVSLFADLDELQIVSGDGPVDSDVVAFYSLIGANVGVVSAEGLGDVAPDGFPASDDFLFSGALAPDTYALTIGAQAEVAGFENSLGFALASFGFEMRVVPEPGAALLLAAVAGACAMRRGGARPVPGSGARTSAASR